MLALSVLLGGLPAQAGEGWSFRLMPYAWLAGLSGDVATLPGAPEAEVDLSFGDILENLDFAAFAFGEARRGDFFLRAEATYARIGTDADTPGPLFSGADLTSTTFMAGLAAGYTVARGPGYQIDAFAGARLWVVDTDLDLFAGRLSARTVSETETFVDPVVGASVRYELARDWEAGLTGSIGGFGVGSDFEWSVAANVAYAVGENWSVVAGYRYLAVDYDHGGFVFDVSQQGPFVGVMFEF